MRILLFTGKGGVGKSTVAAATALRTAEAGLRTLVCSTDPAHSLADAFDDASLGDEPSPIATLGRGTLFGQQLDARARLEESWGEVRDYLTALLDWAGAGVVEAEELAVIPGLDEVFALADIRAHAESGEYDVIVVDCAPTAETLRLLSLPDVLTWYMDRLVELVHDDLDAYREFLAVVHLVKPPLALMKPGIASRVLGKWARTRLSGQKTLIARNYENCAVPATPVNQLVGAGAFVAIS